jgi:hypothetical protein
MAMTPMTTGIGVGARDLVRIARRMLLLQIAFLHLGL